MTAADLPPLTAEELAAIEPPAPPSGALILWRGATHFKRVTRWELVVRYDSGGLDLLTWSELYKRWDRESDLHPKGFPASVAILLRAALDLAESPVAISLGNTATAITAAVAAHCGVEMGEDRLAVILRALDADTRAALDAEQERCAKIADACRVGGNPEGAADAIRARRP